MIARGKELDGDQSKEVLNRETEHQKKFVFYLHSGLSRLKWKRFSISNYLSILDEEREVFHLDEIGNPPLLWVLNSQSELS